MIECVFSLALNRSEQSQVRNYRQKSVMFGGEMERHLNGPGQDSNRRSIWKYPGSFIGNLCSWGLWIRKGITTEVCVNGAGRQFKRTFQLSPLSSDVASRMLVPFLHKHAVQSHVTLVGTVQEYSISPSFCNSDITIVSSACLLFWHQFQITLSFHSTL